jgi:hypothetical protein
MQKWVKGLVRPVLCALVATGCASGHSHLVGQEERPLAQEEAPVVRKKAREPGPPPEPTTFARRYPRPERCEAVSRRLLATSRDDAWTALKSCVEGTHFTLLKALLSDAWAEELRVRPDGAQVLARVIANRGGSVAGELELLHARKVPIFGLEAAVAQPDTYKGRYVLLRAQVADVRSEGEKSTVWLVEQGLGSIATERELSPSYRTDVATASASANHATASNERWSRSVTETHYENISSETGREALGRLAQPDPFLEPGKDFVVLARFDGVRITSSGGEDEEDAQRLPVLTIVSYYAPHPLVVY